MGADRAVNGAVRPEQLASLLDDLFADLLRQSEGDALGVHTALAETFPAMPREMRTHVVEFASARPDQIYAQLGCFWLLDSDPVLRQAAAAGLSARLAANELDAETTARLTVLRNWMPEDLARARVDQLLREALRKGVAPAAQRAPWTIHSVVATLPDGGGAQSLAVSLQSGGRRGVAMLLVKEGHGIKDAYVIPCGSASEQRSLVQRLSSETGAQVVPLAYLEEALVMALGDGMVHGVPPAPGLIEIADLCGLGDLRPKAIETEALLKAKDKEGRLAGLSAQAKGRLINASEVWWDVHEMVHSWFEDSDAAHEVLDAPKAPRLLERDLWTWLETRRGWWARLIARSAAMLTAAGHKDADSFVAVARALLEGRDLKKIPVMLDVHEQTIATWIADDPGGPLDAGVEDLARLPGALPRPKPEKKGELARLLKGADITAEGIDGFLTAVVVAPKLIAPNRWVPIVIQSAVAALSEGTIQRFVELVMIRVNGVIEAAEDEAQLLHKLRSLTKHGQQDWAEGFMHSVESFKSSWPAKSMDADDRAALRVIAGGTDRGFSGADLATLAQWIAARHTSN
jgi:yecA family protein